MRKESRRGVATIVATLIMVAAATMFSSIMLFWGLSFQGQSLTNFGDAISRSNNAAAEQISIDALLFSSVTTSPVTYTATVYARNFGDQPVKIAGVHIVNLQTGSSPPGYDCEVAAPGHLTIVARATGAITLNSSCKTPIVFPACYNGATISVTLSTEGGTSFSNNYLIPPATVAVTSHSDTPSTTAPSFTFTIGNVGCSTLGTQSISSIIVSGASSNGVNHFTGTVTATIPSSGTFTPSASDSSTWTASPNTASSYQSISSGSSVSITLSTSAAGSGTKLVAGDVFTVQLITASGSTYTAQYTA